MLNTINDNMRVWGLLLANVFIGLGVNVNMICGYHLAARRGWGCSGGGGGRTG